MDILNAILLLWSVISLFLYITVIIILVKNRHSEPFDAPFFSLFVSLGLADILAAVHLYGYALSRYWGWLDFEPLFTHKTLGWFSMAWIFIANNFITFNQFLGVFWIAVNRFLTIAYPHEDIWTAKVHRIALASQWLVSFVVGGLPWFFQEYDALPIVVEPNTTRSYTYMSVFTVKDHFGPIYKTVAYGIFWNVIALLIAYLYIRCFQYARKIQRQTATISAGLKNNIKLGLMGFTVFVLMVAMNSLQILASVPSVVNALALREVFTLIYYTSQVVFTLANPWLLCLLSRPTRDKFRVIFHRGDAVYPI